MPTMFLSAVRKGYRDAPSAQKSGFWMLSSMAVTISIARAISYVLERRRVAPTMRSLLRQAMTVAPTEGLRVHHFLPGIAIAFGAGGTAIITRASPAEFWFSAPFGVGTALTFDELALLAKADNPYWRSERLAIIQAATAAMGATALGGGFAWRGARGLHSERARPRD